MDRLYNIPEEPKIEIFKNVSRLSKLPDFAVEKAWWVTQTLAILFEMEIGKHLVFLKEELL